MSGADFLWWLQEIWFDLTNLDTADLPSLFFRLLLLIIGGTILLRVTLAITGGFPLPPYLLRRPLPPPPLSDLQRGRSRGAAGAGTARSDRADLQGRLTC